MNKDKELDLKQKDESIRKCMSCGEMSVGKVGIKMIDENNLLKDLLKKCLDGGKLDTKLAEKIRDQLKK